MAAAWPAERAGPKPTAASPVGSRLQGREPLTWFDRDEPIGVPATLALLLSVAVLLAGCGYAVWHAHTSTDVRAVPVEVTQFQAVTGLARPSPPVRVRIPAIGVNAALERLGKSPDGTVQVPRHWRRAGWFTGGPRPGELGSAVLLGHYDSYCCPAVFYRLGELRPGDRIWVERAQGEPAVFRVTRTGQYHTTRFPVREVYFPTLRPLLRLITCAGPYQRNLGRYRDNIVVFAEQVSAPPAG